MGRPLKITAQKLAQLEEAFLLGCTDLEACFHADIAPRTLYDYQTLHPEFAQRKAALKQAPYYRARKTFVNALENPDFAVKYLERKKKKEFSLRTETCETGEIKHVVHLVSHLPDFDDATKNEDEENND